MVGHFERLNRDRGERALPVSRATGGFSEGGTDGKTGNSPSYLVWGNCTPLERFNFLIINELTVYKKMPPVAFERALTDGKYDKDYGKYNECR